MDLVNSSYMVTFNNLSQNTPANWACSVSSSPCANAAFPPPPGNVSMDPLLEGVGAEAVRFCPRGNSPILDQGPAIPPSEPLDFFGRLRVLDGDLDGTATVDLGYCETDEGSSLLVHSSGLVTWDASVNMLARYNLYRGDLDVLLSSCATGCSYTQDLAMVAEARRFCDVVSPSLTDPEVPLFDKGFFYLVTAEDILEGGLGWMNSLLPANDHPCP